MIGLQEFPIALSKIMLTACADPLLYNLNLIKLYQTFAKPNAAVKTASESCSLSVKQTLFDLVEQRPSSLIINFEQVIKYFLV